MSDEVLTSREPRARRRLAVLLLAVAAPFVHACVDDAPSSRPTDDTEIGPGGKEAPSTTGPSGGSDSNSGQGGQPGQSDAGSDTAPYTPGGGG